MLELSEKHREILRLREVEGLTFEDCAQAIGLGNGGTQARYRAACQQRDEIARVTKVRQAASSPLNLLLEDLPIDDRCRRALKAAEIVALKDLANRSLAEINEVPGLGPGGIKQVTETLGSYGLKFSKQRLHPKAAPQRFWRTSWTRLTWREFLNAGGTVYGLPEHWENTVTQRMNPGDLLICYMRGECEFFALLEVMSEGRWDNKQIWSEDIYPVRVSVKVLFKPARGIKVLSLRDRLAFFKRLKNQKVWGNYFQSSLREMPAEEGLLIKGLLEEAVAAESERDQATMKSGATAEVMS